MQQGAAVRNQIDEQGISYSNIVHSDEISRLFEIDKSIYDASLVVKCSTIEKWFDRNPRLYCVARDNASGQIIAYLGIFPLVEEVFHNALDPDFDESSIRPEDIEMYDHPGMYYLYANSVAVAPEYQRKFSIYRNLYKGLADLVVELAQKNMYFKEMCGRSISLIGDKINKQFSMRLVSDNGKGLRVFYQTLLPFRITPPGYMDHVRALYDKKYRQLTGSEN